MKIDVSIELLGLMKPKDDELPVLDDCNGSGAKKVMSIEDYAFDLEKRMNLPVGTAGAMCVAFHEAAIEYRRSIGITDHAKYWPKRK